VSTLTPPAAITGFATEAGNLASIKTAVEVIDNIVSGSEAQVDIVAALPAGTNAIGKLAANSGVDIGDVDVTSLPALTTGTNIIGAVKRDVINYTSVNKYYANTGAVTDGIVWSPAGGKQVVITDLAMTTSAAATVTLQWDKTGGDEDVMAFDLAANGGVSMNLQTPIVCTEDDADLIITTSAGNVKIMISGYEL
jgi:hypothetical protein